MATLNINLTQSSVNQREAYIQAKSAISFAESYYAEHSEHIPGIGGTGEGLVLFETSSVGDGAKFIETKSGTNVRVSPADVQKLKDNCVDTYIEVTNKKTSAKSNSLVLKAYCKYGNGNAYKMEKSFDLGTEVKQDLNDFVGTIQYEPSPATRYVRVHVRATTAFEGAPYFYMWYHDRSNMQMYDEAGNKIASTGIDDYGQSTIVNKLSYNNNYSTIQNGTFVDGKAYGECAMSYEGNGWYMTKKTFNLNRRATFLNGLITKTGGKRTDGGVAYDHQQSYEFFGIPIPMENETGPKNAVDLYIDINQNDLKDMLILNKWYVDDSKRTQTNSRVYSFRDHDSGGTMMDEFNWTYDHSSGSTGKEKLNDFVTYMNKFYTVFTKSDTAIVHYRESGITTKYYVDAHGNYTDAAGNSSASPVETGIPGFTYEGYGWWRSFTHDFNKSVVIGSSTYSYGSGKVISYNTVSGKEIIRELFICADGDESAAFGEEEDANIWFVKHGDINAGDYVEVNVKANGQPVDRNEGATISYKARIYDETVKIPAYDDTNVIDISTKEEKLEFEKLKNSGEGLTYKDLVSDTTIGNYYIIGTMNSTPWGEVSGDTHRWQNTDVMERQELTNNFYREYSVTPGQPIKFWVAQIPKGVETSENYTFYRAETYEYVSESTFNIETLQWEDQVETIENYTNVWGDNNNVDDEHQYCRVYIPESDKITIYFNADAETISIDDYGTGSSDRKIYSVVGWMNDWGADPENAGSYKYKFTDTMELYSDTQGVLTYNDPDLKIESGDTKYFKIVERSESVTDDTEIDWTKVYGNNGDCSNIAGVDEANAVVVHAPEEPAGQPKKQYYVTLLYGPQNSADPSSKKIPKVTTTEVIEDEYFYLLSPSNGWFMTKDPVTNEEVYPEDYDTTKAASYRFEEESALYDQHTYTYTLPELQEIGTYNIRILSSKGTTGNKPNYDLSWGKTISNVEGQPGYLVSQGPSALSFEYTLTERGYVTFKFIYEASDPAKSKIEPISELNGTFKPYEGSPDTVYVGFYNGKLENIHDSALSSKFGGTAGTDVWPENSIYITYKTAETGFNCFRVTKKDADGNFWAKVPQDAEYLYFSNGRTNDYNTFHSEDFQYTDNITSDKFKGAASSIFFPITDNKDTENRTRWSVGDSQKYNEYVNDYTDIEETDAPMAYYGSTQCNYYDAPIVNVLNMLVTKGDPSPTQKYFFTTALWPNGYRADGHKYYFSKDRYVNFMGEKFYYDSIPADKQSGWTNKSSLLLVKSDASASPINGYMFEGDLGMEENSGSYATNYYGYGGYNLRWNLYMMNRAGGVFVSDRYYRNDVKTGRRLKDGNNNTYDEYVKSESYFNYVNVLVPSGEDVDATYADGSYKYVDGYTPSWYTYRVAASSTVKISDIKGCRTATDPIITGKSFDFPVVKETTHVNRPVYVYKDVNDKVKNYSYNIDQGVVDNFNNSGTIKSAVFFLNTEDWEHVNVHAFTPFGEVYLKGEESIPGGEVYFAKDGTNGDYYDDGGNELQGHAMYKFEFNDGDYCFFQFFDGDSATKAGLESAANKSQVVYFTGEEFKSSDDQYNVNYSGLNIDPRTTKTLCEGPADGLTWYMHPRISIMHTYLDMDSVNQLTQDTEYYGYIPDAGAYALLPSGNEADMVKIDALASIKTQYENQYKNGNTSASHGASKAWKSSGVGDKYAGLLEAASEFMDTVRQARVYISDKKAEAGTHPNRETDEWKYNSTSDTWYWIGNDPDHRMVYMEGEQLEKNSAFEYDAKWVGGLKNVYKSIMFKKTSSRTQYNYFMGIDPATRQKLYSRVDITNSIYNKSADDITKELFENYTAQLKAWLDNPRQTLKDEAVQIIIDDTPENGKGGWGNTIGLYVKTKSWDINTGKWVSSWQPYDGSELSKTTQSNFYAYVLVLEDGSPYTNCEFTIAPSCPDANNMVDGATVVTQTLQARTRYRANTRYYDKSGKKFDPEKFLSVDQSVETKIFSGNKIEQTRPDASLNEISATDLFNEFVSLHEGDGFKINFMYDTVVTYYNNGNTSDKRVYTIYAGCYDINESTYSGFKKDLAGDSHTGINVFTDNARVFFKTPENYGMTTAKNYSNWNSSRTENKNNLDIMTKNINAGNKDITGSAPNSTVSFRYNGEKGAVLTMLPTTGITLKGNKIIMAANVIDFRTSEKKDFILDSKTIEFKTDTYIVTPSGERFMIDHGKYVYNNGAGNKVPRVSLKSTLGNPKEDWRKYYSLVSDSGNTLKKGMIVVD